MQRINQRVVLAAFVILSFVFCLYITASSSRKLHYEIIETIKHDPELFTQGLIFVNGYFYESSGLYNKSFIRRYSVDHNEILQTSMPDDIFAEGLTILQENLYLLSWKSGRAFIIDPMTLKITGMLNYTDEGWGITQDGKSLITSNGTSILSFRDSETFEITRQINVHSLLRKYGYLNELEYANRNIWANIWQQTSIIKISPETGKVKGILDLSEIASRHQDHGESVLNGIAWDESKKAYWVTGKNWNKKYLIKIY